ncbi:uncharacterized protein LOC122548148 [Chiloscyllium plagiosum]|uniref:uncharacterized protein LOC122548148 n=1 Tax=Chiloscyllium plagiosum TaxID=36176 RepID=UPI001CB87FA0|nr:uncharacterized protein LOC122548148 [Chiloscyllium plagiosum]
MCPEGYQLDTLTEDCVEDRGLDVATWLPVVPSTKILIENVQVTEPTATLSQDYLWIVYLAVAMATLITMATIIVLITCCIQHHKTKARKAHKAAAESDEYEKLNGSNSGNNGIFYQENNSNSQALNGISKDSVMLKNETGNGVHAVLSPAGSQAWNGHLECDNAVDKRSDESYPLPATELGATVLVTTKTTQVPRVPLES